MSRELYVSTSAVATPRDLWHILDACRAVGLDRVELGHCRVPEQSRTELAARLRARPERFLVHNYFPPFAGDLVLNLASADPDIEAQSREFVLAALELCAEVELPVYSMHCGFITDPVAFDGLGFVLPPPTPGQEEAAWRRFAENVARVLDRAGDLGVQLLVENSVCTPDDVGKLLLLHAEEFVALFRMFPSLGLLLDTGHLSVTALTLGFDPAGFVDAVAPHVRQFHAHQNGGVEDTHDPVGEGWVLETLRRPELDGATVVVEAKLPDAEALAAHVRWLGSMLTRANSR